jgi:hypothetical protein
MKYAAIFVLIGSLALELACSGGRRSGNVSGGRGDQSGNAAPAGGGSQTSQPAATPSPQPTQDPLPVLQKLTTDLGTALAQGNADQLNDLLSDGYLHINDLGQLVTKPDIISGIRNGTVKFNSVNIQEVNVRVYGDAAVITANFMGTSAAGARSSNVEDRVTLVAAREGDSWRFVSGQTTPMHPVAQGGNTKSSANGGMGQGGNGGIMGSGSGGTGTGNGASGGSPGSGPGGSQGGQGGSSGTGGGGPGGL